MTTPVTMPRLGESVAEGTIGAWLKQEGDYVELDGQWIRGTFAVARIDNVRGGRY